jgi:hypothetical protein
LHNKFGVKSYLRKKGYTFIIYIPAKEFVKFKRIILPYMLPSMLYKVGGPKIGMSAHSFYNFLFFQPP